MQRSSGCSGYRDSRSVHCLLDTVPQVGLADVIQLGNTSRLGP